MGLKVGAGRGGRRICCRAVPSDVQSQVNSVALARRRVHGDPKLAGNIRNPACAGMPLLLPASFVLLQWLLLVFARPISRPASYIVMV